MAVDIYTRNGTNAGRVTLIDETPTENSQNVVQSGGVYNATEDDKSITSTVTNLIDKSKVVPGSINTSTGAIDTSTTYHVTDYIEVDLSKIYISPKCNKFGAYNESKQFISAGNASPDARYVTGAVSFPAGTKFVRLQIIENGVDDAIFVEAKYYNKDVTVQDVVTGFSDHFKEAFPIGQHELALSDNTRYTTGINLFDYGTDYVQATSGNVTGLSQHDGVFQYKYDVLTDDSEIVDVFSVSLDKYYPIVYGQKIVSNKGFGVVVFYDSSKQYIIGDYYSRAKYYAISAPENSAYVRVAFKGTTNLSDSNAMHSLSEIKDICIWTEPTIGSNIYFPAVRTPQPALQIDGCVISPNYLDKVVPNMVESDFLSAMRCMAIREVNARDHAWRFGNFNMWIMEHIKGWNMTKKMLMDYGVDFCGFEECVIAGSGNDHFGIAEFLHGWQFPSGFYTNWTDGSETQIEKSFVSRFEVIESTKLSCPSASSNATYLNCKVRLPRYMDVYEPVRILSVYVVHFPMAQAPEKIAVAKDLLRQIATDDSEFVVILGDTNDFGAKPETKDYWVTLEAGGFKPVLPYDIKTVTQDDGSDDATEQDPARWWKTRAIDQFFISSNIEAISYGIKNTKEDYAIPDSAVSANTDYEIALSDHDFVYCDLKFKYDEPRTIVSVPD